MTSPQLMERTVNVTKQYHLRSSVLLPLLFGKQKFFFFLPPPPPQKKKNKTPDRWLQTVLPS